MQNRIVNSAQELFGLYGFKKTTMDDIAKALGKTKSAIYYYYKSKEDILQAVVEKEINKGIEVLTKTVNSVESASEKIAAYIRTRIYTKQSIASFYSSLEQDYFEHYEFIKKIRVELDKKELELIIKMIKKGIEQNIFSIQDVNLTAVNILNVFRGLEYTYLKKKNYKILQKEIDNISSILLKGLLKR